MQELQTKLESNIDRLKADVSKAVEDMAVVRVGHHEWMRGYIAGLTRAIEVLEDYED